MLFAEGLSKFTVALRAASLRFFLVAAVALLLPSLAQATVVARNLYSADDYVLTYDSETNLEWLDWNSALVPLAETAARLQPGGFFDGYALATQAQVQTLIAHFVQSSGLPDYRLLDLMGFTGVNSDGAYASFYTKESLDSIYSQNGYSLIGIGASSLGRPSIVFPSSTYYATACNCPQQRADLYYGSGAALYRVAPSVPEPDAWLLMIVGFAGVGFAMRRRAMSEAV